MPGKEYFQSRFDTMMRAGRKMPFFDRDRLSWRLPFRFDACRRHAYELIFASHTSPAGPISRCLDRAAMPLFIIALFVAHGHSPAPGLGPLE